jgi:hypothetical protein
MNYESLFGLLGLALGPLLTLAFQSHQKAVKAVKEAKEAVEGVDALSQLVRKQQDTFARQIEASIEVNRAEADKRIQKLEIRLEDATTRLTALQIKR